MKKSLAAGALVLPLVALAAYFAFQPQPRAEEGLRAGTFEPAREAPAFTLEGSNGSKLSLRDHLGKVVILYFGFTYCDKVCPVTLARLTEAYKKLGNTARDIQLIFISVDPKRDSPERMREHLTAFNPSFLGATGTSDDLAAVRSAYGVVAEEVASKNKALGYEVNHSSSLYLVDRQGKIRALVPYGTPSEDIAHDLAILLKM